MEKKTELQEEEQQTTGKGATTEEGGSAVLRTAETLLRVAPMGLCVGAMAVMLRNSEENDFGAVSYSDLSAFTYLVCANGLCAAYSLFSAFFTAAMPRPATVARAWTVFFCDQVLTYVILAAGTVSSEILYLAYKGDEKVTWSRQCGVFSNFCSSAAASVGITFGAAACYVLLSLISSYRLFSTYDAPNCPFFSNNKDTVVMSPAFPR